MIEGSLARRYAKALFQLAREDRREEEVGKELELFHGVYADSELHGALNNPAFPVPSRKAILRRVATSLGLSPLVINFLSLLLERHRLVHLPGIVSRYGRLLNDAKGRVEARVVSASPLEPGLLEKLTGVLKTISGKEVMLHAETDPELIGGLLVELEGKVYDGSVRTQLDNMRQRIARGY